MDTGSRSLLSAENGQLEALLPLSLLHSNRSCLENALKEREI